MLNIGANVLLARTSRQRPRRDTLRALERRWRIRRLRVIISHDRWFLDRIATHIWRSRQQPREWFEGNFQATRTKEAAPGDRLHHPHRIKYKKLQALSLRHDVVAKRGALPLPAGRGSGEGASDSR